MDDAHETSYSLLARALDYDDREAWDRMVSSYDKFIYYLLRKSQINENELDDLRQQVMANLVRDLKKYNRNKGRFRVWFSHLVRSTIQMHYRKRMSEERKAEAYELNAGIYSQPENEIDTYFTKQWELYLMRLAMDRVKEKYRGQAVEVFELGLDGLSTNEIIAQTGLSEASVYKYKQRVKRSLMIEISFLKQELEPQ